MDKIDDYLEMPDPINHSTKKLAMVLGREMTGKIIASIYLAPYQSASDIARNFDIHIATAQKYLLEMKEVGILDSRWRKNSNRPTEEYWLAKNRFDIQVDLEDIPKLTDLELLAAKTYIRQRDNVSVAFDTNRTSQMIKEIILLNGREGRQIGHRIKLDGVEGRFTWHLPSPTDAPASVMELLKRARLSTTELPRIMELVEKLATIKINGKKGQVGIIERSGVNKDE